MNIYRKKLTPFLAVIALSGVIASSLVMAGDHSRDMRHGPNLERLAAKLELTDAQIPQFNEIMKEQGAKRQELHAAFREAMGKQRQETLSELAQVLDDAQLEAMHKMMEKKQKSKKGMKKHESHD